MQEPGCGGTLSRGTRECVVSVRTPLCVRIPLFFGGFLNRVRIPAATFVELLQDREEHVIHLDAVPDRELPDGHPRVVHYDAIVTEAVDELA